MNYYYDVDYFPIVKDYHKEFKSVVINDQTKPSIVKTIKSGVYEINDSHLLYTIILGEYDVLLYKFKYEGISFQAIKYKQKDTASYTYCVKSENLVESINVIVPDYNTNLLIPISFDPYKYYAFDDPAYLVKKDGVTINLISEGNTLYACYGSFGIEIGKIDTDIKRIFCKAEEMGGSIYIFDAYIFGEILDLDFKSRMKKIDLGKIKFNDKYKILVSTVHEKFDDAMLESEKISNDGIIIQPPYDPPIKWKPSSLNTVDFYVDRDLFLRKGHNSLLNFKKIYNPKFNRNLIFNYVKIYNGEIIELGIDGSFHRNRLDKNKPNAVGTYTSILNPTTETSLGTMKGTDTDVVNYILSNELNRIFEHYMHGYVMESNLNCITIKSVDNLIERNNVIEILNGSIADSCINHFKINKNIPDYLLEMSSDPNSKKADTIVVLNNPAIGIPKLLDLANLVTSECAHVVIKTESKDIPEHANFKLTEVVELKNSKYRPFISDFLFNKIDSRIAVYTKKNKQKPLFIFVIGLMGSGKSIFIHNIRNYIHPPTQLNVINVDNEVAKHISYNLYNNEETYFKIRTKINAETDEKIARLIAEGQCIILESTKADEKYVNEIKKTHKVLIIICNLNLDTLKNNITIRNSHNIRKTVFSEEEYKKFQEKKKEYINIADEVFEFSMETKNFVKL